MSIDDLAEAFYADRDPAFSEIDEDLEAQRERHEDKVLSLVGHKLQDVFDDLDEDEIEIVKRNDEAITERLFEIIEEL